VGTVKTCIATAIVIIMVVTLTFYPAFSSLVATVIVQNTGQISLLIDQYPTSASAASIQAAVDYITAHGGRGTVHLPEGTWNFINQGQSWQTVNIPAGINVTGAPPTLNSSGQVTAWKTIIAIPEVATANNPDAPPVLFSVVGNQNYNTPFRFSNISFIGPRYYNSASTNMFIAVNIGDVFNFRVDHCNFQDICGSAVWAGDNNGGTGTNQYTVDSSCGVIDHCILNNTYGYPGFLNYDQRTLGYGIGLRKWATSCWEPAQTVWGKYTNYTVVIEDNYFSKWRHCVCSNDGYHVIFRNNVVDKDYGDGSIDGHGSYADDSHPLAVGTRCWEVYNNTFQNPDLTWASQEWNGYAWALNIRGGSWIVFNNTFIGHWEMLDFNNDWGNYAPYRPDCAVNQTYIWSNNFSGTMIHYNADSVQNVNYFLRAPSIGQDGLTYSPYIYPSPLAT
jgi:hypothetical protein